MLNTFTVLAFLDKIVALLLLVLHHALNPLVRLNMLPLSLDVLSSLLFLLLADNGGLGHGGFSLAEISRRFS